MSNVLSFEVVGQELLVLKFTLAVLEVTLEFCVLETQLCHPFGLFGLFKSALRLALLQLFPHGFCALFVFLAIDLEVKALFNQLVDVALQPADLKIGVFKVRGVVLRFFVLDPVRLVLKLGLLNLLLKLVSVSAQLLVLDFHDFYLFLVYVAGLPQN